MAAAARHAVGVARIGGVVVYLAVFGGLVGFPITVCGRAEIRCITEAYRRRYRVTEHLQRELLVPREIVGPVHLGVGRHVEVVVIQMVESVGRVPAQVIFRVGVVGLGHLSEEPYGIVVEARRYVDVVEQVERRRYGNLVLDAVHHLVEDVGRKQFVLLGLDRVGEATGIGDRNLLVPPLFAYGIFSPEGKDLRHVERSARQGELYGGVAGVYRGAHTDLQGEGGTRPALAVGDGRFGGGADVVVQRCGGVLPEAAGGEVHRGGKGRAGIELGVLLVGPLQLETRRVYVVGIARFADDGLGVTAGYPAAVFVSLYVSALGGELPRTVSVDAAQQRQVHVFTRCPIVTAVAQEESAGGLLAVARDDDTGTAPLREGEKAFGNGNGQRYVLHDEVGRTDDDFLLRDDLRLGETEVEVRMVGLVAGRIFAGADVDGVVRHLLHVVAQQKAFALLRRHALDFRLARFEVVEDGVHRKCGAALHEYGPCPVAEGVADAGGIHLFGIQFYAHEIGLHVHVAVSHVAAVIDVNELLFRTVHERVLVLAAYHVVEKIVDPYRVVPGRVLRSALFGRDVVREEDHGVEGGVVLRQRLLAYRPELAESLRCSRPYRIPLRFGILPCRRHRRGGIALRRKRCGGGDGVGKRIAEGSEDAETRCMRTAAQSCTEHHLYCQRRGQQRGGIF